MVNYLQEIKSNMQQRLENASASSGTAEFKDMSISEIFESIVGIKGSIRARIQQANQDKENDRKLVSLEKTIGYVADVSDCMHAKIEEIMD